jgi:hypothetical protein
VIAVGLCMVFITFGAIESTLFDLYASVTPKMGL